MTQVLVVEDDALVRDTLRMLLEDTEHSVRECSTGESALDALRGTSERYVVLLDLIMPGLDGVSLLRTVCADPQLSSQHAYIVVTAGSPRSLDEVRPLLNALQGQMVPKPFDVDTLLQAITVAERRLRGTTAS